MAWHDEANPGTPSGIHQARHLSQTDPVLDPTTVVRPGHEWAELDTDNATIVAEYYRNAGNTAWVAFVRPSGAVGAHAASHGAAGADPVTIAQSQVTGLATALAAKAPTASPTFTGHVSVPAPTASTDAATKQYVDDAVTGSADLAALEARVGALDTAPQAANVIYGGPQNTGSAPPTFRALVANDIPALPQAKITNLTTDLAAKAPLASPAFTGTPTAPTPSAGDSSTKLATTAFVADAITGLGGGGGGGGQVLGYAVSNTATAAINPHNTAYAALSGMSVTFTLDAPAVVRVSASVRAMKSGGFFLAVFDGATQLGPNGGWTPVPGSVPPVGWESSPPASAGSPPDNQHQQCTFSQIFALAAGEHTITLQQAAALNANTITFYDRSLVVEQLA